MYGNHLGDEVDPDQNVVHKGLSRFNLETLMVAAGKHPRPSTWSVRGFGLHLMFRVSGFGLRVKGFGFRVQG